MAMAVGVKAYGLLPKLVNSPANMKDEICRAAVNSAVVVTCASNHSLMFLVPKIHDVIMAARLQHIMGKK
jgi:hypothetical protein